MKKTAIFILTMLFLSGSFSLASSELCYEFYKPTFKTRVKRYWAEIKENPLRRPFLKDNHLEGMIDRDEFDGGFFVPSEAMGFSLFRPVFQAIPRRITKREYGRRYDIAPMHYIYRNTIYPATLFLTNKVFKKPLELTKLTKTLGILTMAVAAFVVYDVKTREAIGEKGQQMLMQNLPAYKKLLETDFNFQELRKNKDFIKMPDDLMVIYASHIRSLQKNYFDYIGTAYQTEHTADKSATNIRILNEPTWGRLFFRDIKGLMENGIPEGSAYFLYPEGFNSKIGDEQLDLLLRNRHFSLHKMEYIRGLVERAKTRDDILKAPDIQDYFDTPRSLELLAKTVQTWDGSESGGRDLVRQLQVSTHWEERLGNYAALGLKLVEPSSSGPVIVTLDGVFSKIETQKTFVEEYYKDEVN